MRRSLVRFSLPALLFLLLGVLLFAALMLAGNPSAGPMQAAAPAQNGFAKPEIKQAAPMQGGFARPTIRLAAPAQNGFTKPEIMQA